MEFWIVWFALGICFIVLFTCMILPKIMLKTHAATIPVRDRSLEKRTGERGTVVSYEPAASIRPYIRSYRVATDERGVYFQGVWNRKIAFAKYELIVFNAANEIIEIVRVKEKFNNDRVTHITRLPKGTDFVSLRLLCVDDTPFPDERRPFNAKYCLWLLLQCLSFAVTVDLVLWVAGTLILRIFDGFQMYYSLPASVWVTFLGWSAAGVVLVTAALSLLRFFLLRRRRDSHES